MELNCWEQLGITPTTDVRQIKKAYAVLLKQHRPDKDPQGYQTLREAYDEAMAMVATDSVEIEPQGQISDSLEVDLDRNFIELEPSQAIQTQEQQAADAFFDSFLDKMELLLTKPNPFADLSEWQALLSESALDSIDMRRSLSLPVFSLLSFYLLKKKQQAWDQNARTTLASLDETFRWQDNELDLERHFDVEQVDAVMLLVGGEAQRVPPSASDQNGGSSGKNFWLAVFFWPIFLFGVFALTNNFPNSGGKDTDNNVSSKTGAEEKLLNQVKNHIEGGRYREAEAALEPYLIESSARRGASSKQFILKVIGLRYRLYVEQKQFVQALAMLDAQKVKLPQGYLDLLRGAALESLGRYAEAATALSNAAETGGDNPKILNEVTWRFATHWNPELRDAKLALKYGRQLEVVGVREWGAGLDTVAAAYAANGHFTQALKIQRDAIAAYVEEPPPDEVVNRVDLYQERRTYIAPPPSTN